METMENKELLPIPTGKGIDYYDILGIHYFGKGTMEMKAVQYRWLIECWCDLIHRDIENHWDIDTFIKRNRLKVAMTKPREGLL